MDAELLLNTYMEEDADKFATLIELYTKNKDYLIQVKLILGDRLLTTCTRNKVGNMVFVFKNQYSLSD